MGASATRPTAEPVSARENRAWSLVFGLPSVKAAAAVLEAMRPPGNIEMPKGMSGVMGSFDLSALAARLGEGFANAALGSVAGEEISAAGVEWAKSVVSRLPPEAIEAIRSNRQRNRS